MPLCRACFLSILLLFQWVSAFTLKCPDGQLWNADSHECVDGCRPTVDAGDHEQSEQALESYRSCCKNHPNSCPPAAATTSQYLGTFSESPLAGAKATATSTTRSPNERGVTSGQISYPGNDGVFYFFKQLLFCVISFLLGAISVVAFAVVAMRTNAPCLRWLKELIRLRLLNSGGGQNPESPELQNLLNSGGGQNPESPELQNLLNSRGNMADRLQLQSTQRPLPPIPTQPDGERTNQVANELAYNSLHQDATYESAGIPWQH